MMMAAKPHLTSNKTIYLYYPVTIYLYGFNLREEGIIYILKEIECNGMKWNKSLLVIAFSLVVVLLVSCSAASSSPSFKAIASHGLEGNEMG